MDDRIKCGIIIIASASVVTLILTGLIVEIYLIIGDSVMAASMINNTLNGELFGLKIVSGGPLAIWGIIAAIILFIFSKAPNFLNLGLIYLALDFDKEDDPNIPSPANLINATCTYSIYDLKEESIKILKDEVAKIQIGNGNDFDKGRPFIIIERRKLISPMISVHLSYNGHNWHSDSYSPKKGCVTLYG